MYHDPLLLRTRLAPPRTQARVLPRPALAARLGDALDHRLTLVQAGTGYSKTTALATLAAGPTPLCWYSVGEADTDPPRFLAYLIAALRQRLPGLSDLPGALLAEPGRADGPGAWDQVLDALINALTDVLTEPVLLVCDDFHFVAATPAIAALIERFLTDLPPALHVVLATRYPLSGAGLARWRARGEVLEIGRPDLAFAPEEIAALFRDLYCWPLAPADLALLVEKTEGWPIAVQLVWQGLRRAAPGGGAGGVAGLLAQGSTSLDTLFDYLARDVLDAQPPELAAFLRDTAVLRELTPAACAAVATGADSAALLDRLHELDLFVVALGARHYRYHHLFHAFLQAQAAADPAGPRARHQRAAAFFAAGGADEEAIYHWLAAGDLAAAAAVIERAGEGVLRAGWLDTVARWIDALPAAVLADHPLLQAYLGDLCRLRSRFDEALAWYAQAEQLWRARDDRAGVGRALRGQALVYLDTVRPAQAERFLEEALRLADGLADSQARARLLELLAENKLNMGQPAAAEQLRVEARALREEGPGEDTLSVRVKLRTGQLDAAQRALAAWAETERGEVARGQVHPPRAHRETLLILALIHAFRGEAAAAFACAEEGGAVGARLGSPFIAAVAQMRLGHAWQVRPGPADHLAAAIRCYQAAIALGDQLAVRRLRAEAMWGLTRAYGFGGDLDAARRAAAEGVETAGVAGDAWVGALVELALGASLVLAGQRAEAVAILTRVLGAFRDCGDQLGRAATRLWLALAYQDLHQEELLIASLDDLLALCEAQGYDFLLTAPSLLGPPDPRRCVPLLLAARAAHRRPSYTGRLLTALGQQAVQVHPGYQLRVQLLGTFRVWRGADEIAPGDWQRASARQVFQVLLTERERWLQRDEIVDRLWPHLAPDAASRDFKVALNALNRALEPARPPDAPFAFLMREGSAYRLRPEADVWLDAVAFEQDCTGGMRLLEGGATEAGIARLQAGLQLYNGNYLADALYEDWTTAERERLLSLYLRAADQLAGALLDGGRYDETVDIGDRILARDPCWERAYRLLMRAYARQGNRPLAIRAYQRCRAVLRDELGVDPTPATETLYAR
ncbi:MAG TPA: BTAD domain-containing putative transcriptional regulator, partial [Chloroflexia bacterium]|nr:BTAD domain-containing putative transcriptional regulator [Chloroflexia bacterium]